MSILRASRYLLIASALGIIMTEIPIMFNVMLPVEWEMYGIPALMLTLGLGLAGFLLKSPLFIKRRKP